MDAPTDVELRYPLGVIARQLDKPLLAQSWFTATLGMASNHEQARQGLRELAVSVGQQ